MQVHLDGYALESVRLHFVLEAVTLVKVKFP